MQGKLVLATWLLALALSGCIQTPEEPYMVEPCRLDEVPRLTAGSWAEYEIESKVDSMPMFSAPGHQIPWSALGLNQTASPFIVRIEIGPGAESLMDTWGRQVSALKVTYSIRNGSSLLRFHDEWVDLTSGATVASLTRVQYAYEVQGEAFRLPVAIGGFDWKLQGVPPMMGWTTLPGRRSGHENATKIEGLANWVDPLLTPSYNLALHWYKLPTLYRISTSLGPKLDERPLFEPYAGFIQPRCMWWDYVSDHAYSGGLPYFGGRFGNYAWPLEVQFGATPIETHVSDSKVKIPPYAPSVTSPSGMSSRSNNSFLNESTGIFATDYSTMLRVLENDSQAGPWLTTHPNARLVAAYHGTYEAGRELLDRWDTDWEEPGHDWRERRTYLMHAVVNHERSQGLAPLLGENYAVNVHYGHSHGKLYPDPSLGFASLARMTSAYQQLAGKEADSLACDFGEGWCFMANGAQAKWPRPDDPRLDSMDWMADSNGPFGQAGLLFQSHEGRLLYFSLPDPAV